MDTEGIAQAAFHLSVGTVTFMLTDVEGLTRLWESAPKAMGAAVRRHYELLDAAIVLHGGVRPLEQGESDSVVGEFSCRSDALAAALGIQCEHVFGLRPPHYRRRPSACAPRTAGSRQLRASRFGAVKSIAVTRRGGG